MDIIGDGQINKRHFLPEDLNKTYYLGKYSITPSECFLLYEYDDGEGAWKDRFYKTPNGNYFKMNKMRWGTIEIKFLSSQEIQKEA